MLSQKTLLFRSYERDLSDPGYAVTSGKTRHWSNALHGRLPRSPDEFRMLLDPNNPLRFNLLSYGDTYDDCHDFRIALQHSFQNTLDHSQTNMVYRGICIFVFIPILHRRPRFATTRIAFAQWIFILRNPDKIHPWMKPRKTPSSHLLPPFASAKFADCAPVTMAAASFAIATISSSTNSTKVILPVGAAKMAPSIGFYR